MGQLPQFVPESTVADRRRSDRQCAIRRTSEAFHCAPAAPCRRGPANRTARRRSPVGRAAWSVNQKLTAGASGPNHAERSARCSFANSSQCWVARGVAPGGRCQFRKAGQIEFMNHCQLPDCLHRDIRAHPDQIDPLRAHTSSTSTSRKRTPSGGRLRKGTATRQSPSARLTSVRTGLQSESGRRASKPQVPIRRLSSFTGSPATSATANDRSARSDPVRLFTRRFVHVHASC